MTNPLPGVPLVESPLFRTMVDELEFNELEKRIAVDLHEQGFAVFDFPDAEICERVERIKSNLLEHFDLQLTVDGRIANVGGAHRVQDAWMFNEDVRAIAANDAVLGLLSKLYGRRAFPFQTLNFPVGTQQHVHSDSIHFSSIPERFMCGVWLAMEDVGADAGPLTYIPGSHRWPILSNAVIGRKGWQSSAESAQHPFEAAWQAMIEASGSKAENFTPRKGQALIWAANLLHGGSKQIDLSLTRWSQVTHYYFEDCIYYTPAFSDEALGKLDLRTIVNVATAKVEPNFYLGEEVTPAPAKSPGSPRQVAWPWRKGGKTSAALTQGNAAAAAAPALPSDFDPATYLNLNGDVARAGVDPASHYLTFGKREGRRYKA